MVIVTLIALLIAAAFLFVHSAKFGRLPTGERRNLVRKSANYGKRKFNNRSFTPDLSEGTTYFQVFKKVVFEKDPRNKPSGRIPSQHTNINALDPDEDTLIWFGHSSYYLFIDGLRVLVDPVFSGAASPVRGFARSFPGTDAYSAADFTAIDILFITHDHWDHLDYNTMLALQSKVKFVICPLGVGEHLERWGFSNEIIIEKDWDETVLLPGGFEVNSVAARHFSGRGFQRNKSLWISYVLKTPSKNIFIGGDSGYDSHFAEAGRKYGPFDVAILECGQYDESWKYIHMFPEQTVRAALDLNAKALFPVHWGKFALANHAWDEPIIRVLAVANEAKLPLLTPMIGEAVNLSDKATFGTWWDAVDQ